MSQPPASPASSVSARKAELRRIARQNRNALSEAFRARAALRFPQHIPAALRFCAQFASPPAKNARANAEPQIIALYSPREAEANCFPIMQNLWISGKKLLLPAIAKQDKLAFRLFAEGDALVSGKFGIAEPEASAPILAPQAIFLPLLAFDAKGHRLGYGGGYYDRAVADLRRHGANPPLIGLAFAAQELPVWQAEPHDIALDAALTEEGFRIFRQRGQIHMQTEGL